MKVDTFRALFVAGTVLVAASPAWAAPAAAASADEQTYTFDIPAQDLSDALRAFARASRQQVTFEDKTVQGKRNPPLKGAFTASDALDQLLSGSGLHVRKGQSGLFIVRESTPAAGARNDADGNLQLVRVSHGVEAADKTATAAAGESQQIVVEGAREQIPFVAGNLDLTRTEDDVLPFTVFTAEDIKLSGAIDLREFLRNRLPQNVSDDTGMELDATGGNFTRNDQIDMRGWGATETVFLLNGRRMGAEFQPSRGDSDNASPNLRGIPLASVERIEILTSAGSAIYGAGATGGVINIITRRDFSGGQLSMRYETPADVMRPQRSLNFMYVVPVVGGASLRLSGSYSDTEPMLVGERADVSIERYRLLAMQRDPARLIARVNNPADPGSQRYTSRANFFGATPNIRAVSNTGNLFAGLPGVPGSNFTTVPDGYTGGGGRAAFQPGVYNLALADAPHASAPYSLRSPLGTANKNTALNVGLDKSFTERWRWSLEYRYSENAGKSMPSTGLTLSTDAFSYSLFGGSFLGLGLPVQPVVPAAAPTNPFGQDVQVTLADPGLDRLELSNRPRNITWEVSSTLHGGVGQWRGFVDVSYSRNDSRYMSNTFVEPFGGWIAALLSGAYNPFVDSRVTPHAAPAFYENYILAQFISAGTTENYRSSLKASGPVFPLPAGQVQLTAGAEWSRADRARPVNATTTYDSVTGAQRNPSFGAVPAGVPQLPFVFDTYAGYAETNVPLISARQAVPLVEQLEIFGSGRLDRTFRDGVRSSTDSRPVEYSNTSRLYAYGLRYQPLAGVTLRASRSAGFKPPSMLQVTPADPPAPTTQPTNVTDPLRNGATTQITYAMYVAGGNPGLRPEGTSSTNVGLILTPAWSTGTRLSLDYLQSVRSDAIFDLSAQEAVNLESDIPGIVQRGTPDSTGVGPITFIDRRYVNLREVASRSLDISLDQAIGNVGAGRLVLSLIATKNLSFKVQASNLGAPVEQVRNNAGAFTSRQIKWNGNAQIRWEGPQWSFGWSARYFDYLLVQRPATATAVNFAILQGGDRAPRAFSHDVNVSYRAPSVQDPRGAQGWLSDFSLNFGVKNVFDRAPRFWAQDSIRGIAPYDFSMLMGRSLWLQMSKDFQ